MELIFQELKALQRAHIFWRRFGRQLNGFSAQEQI
jgi:hypothetical protein